MGLFKKKAKINLDDSFKALYKEINSLTSEAGNELDFVVKYSLLKLAVEKYDDLLKMIDDGANFDKEYFTSLKKSVVAEATRVKGFIDED